MPRIVYGGPFGSKVASAISLLANASVLLTRALNMANAMSANGATPAGIEQVAEFGMIPTGSGAQFYADLKGLTTALNGALAASAVTDLDQG